MGQYHVLVNVDKQEMVSPQDLGLGAKQWEHLSHPQCTTAGSLADAMYILTMTSPARSGSDMPGTDISGRWAGDRVMVVGDYTEDEDLGPEFLGGLLYTTACTTYENIGGLVRDAFAIVYSIRWRESRFGWEKLALDEALV